MSKLKDCNHDYWSEIERFYAPAPKVLNVSIDPNSDTNSLLYDVTTICYMCLSCGHTWHTRFQGKTMRTTPDPEPVLSFQAFLNSRHSHLVECVRERKEIWFFDKDSFNK